MSYWVCRGIQYFGIMGAMLAVLELWSLGSTRKHVSSLDGYHAEFGLSVWDRPMWRVRINCWPIGVPPKGRRCRGPCKQFLRSIARTSCKIWSIWLWVKKYTDVRNRCQKLGALGLTPGLWAWLAPRNTPLPMWVTMPIFIADNRTVRAYVCRKYWAPRLSPPRVLLPRVSPIKSFKVVKSDTDRSGTPSPTSNENL